MKQALEQLKQIRDNITEKANILETELDVVGASVDDTSYLNNLRKLARLVNDVLVEFEK